MNKQQIKIYLEKCSELNIPTNIALKNLIKKAGTGAYNTDTHIPVLKDSYETLKNMNNFSIPLAITGGLAGYINDDFFFKRTEESKPINKFLSAGIGTIGGSLLGVLLNRMLIGDIQDNLA